MSAGGIERRVAARRRDGAPNGVLCVKDGKTVIDQAKCNADGICIPASPSGTTPVVEEEAG